MEKSKTEKIISSILLLSLMAAMGVFEFITVPFTSVERLDKQLTQSLSLLFGTLAGLFMMCRFIGTELTKRPEQWIWLLPAVIIAVDNFQFGDYLSGQSVFVHTSRLDFVAFSVKCLSVGLFEEIMFRGIVFPLTCDFLSKRNYSLEKALLVQAGIFALCHLVNIFSLGVGGTLRQVGYTFLVGCVSGFLLVKTKNIFVPSLFHALFNFFGTLLESETSGGLGSGVVFSWQTTVQMLSVSIVLGVIILVNFVKTAENEQKELYKRFNLLKKDEKTEKNEKM